MSGFHVLDCRMHKPLILNDLQQNDPYGVAAV
jgi:hypothetical protein